MTAACWNELGIEATDDLVAIRRAYSARLKQIDADQDRDGFICLREAYDLARAEAARRLEPAYDAPLPAEPLTEAAAPVIEAAPDFDDAPAVIAPQYDTQPFQRIDAILFSDRAAEPGDSAELRALTEQILSQQRMELIEHSRDIEGWLADTIAQSDPRGDAMLEPAIARFGWDRDSARWDEHPIIAHLVERRKGAEMLERLAQPDNQFHKAYLDLTIGTGKLSTRGGHDWNILDLINMIRAEAPYAETRLDGERLNQWIDHLNRVGQSPPPLSETFNGSMWIFPLVFALPLLLRFCLPEPPPMERSVYRPVQQPSITAPAPPFTAPEMQPVGVPAPTEPQLPPVSPPPMPSPAMSEERLDLIAETTRRDGAKNGLSRQQVAQMQDAVEREKARASAGSD